MHFVEFTIKKVGLLEGLICNPAKVTRREEIMVVVDYGCINIQYRKGYDGVVWILGQKLQCVMCNTC